MPVWILKSDSVNLPAKFTPWRTVLTVPHPIPCFLRGIRVGPWRGGCAWCRLSLCLWLPMVLWSHASPHLTLVLYYKCSCPLVWCLLAFPPTQMLLWLPSCLQEDRGHSFLLFQTVWIPCAHRSSNSLSSSFLSGSIYTWSVVMSSLPFLYCSLILIFMFPTIPNKSCQRFFNCVNFFRNKVKDCFSLNLQNLMFGFYYHSLINSF